MLSAQPKRAGPGAGHNSISTIAIVALLLLCLGTVAYYLVAAKPPQAGQVPLATVPQNPSETLDVLVPIEKIEVGTQLDPSLFRKETRAIIGGSANVITGFEQLKGAYAASFIAAGEPVLLDYITSNPPLNQIQAKIPDGFRAVTLAVDSTTSVEGWARAGAKVDILLSPAKSEKPSLTMIVQNAKVLSASRSTTSDPGAPPENPTDQTTVTVMVSGADAAKIQLASNAGSLSLALRGDEDTVESPQNTTVGIESIVGIAAKSGPKELQSEGRVKVGGKEFLIIGGKLVSPEEAAAQAAALASKK
jgi:pilus assembly protein CpaB